MPVCLQCLHYSHKYCYLSSAVLFAGLQEIFRLAHGVGGLRSLKEVVLIRMTQVVEDPSHPSRPLDSFIDTLLQALANCQTCFDKVVLVDLSSSIRLQR